MSTWRRVLLLLMMLWLPMQSVVAVAMPMCQGRHASAANETHASATHHTAHAHHAADTHSPGHTHDAADTHHLGRAHDAADTHHAGHAHHAASAAPASDTHHTGHGGTMHDCSGCGACHLACAPLLGVRGFDFAATPTPILIARVQPWPPLRTLDQPHPPPLA